MVHSRCGCASSVCCRGFTIKGTCFVMLFWGNRWNAIQQNIKETWTLVKLCSVHKGVDKCTVSHQVCCYHSHLLRQPRVSYITSKTMDRLSMVMCCVTSRSAVFLWFSVYQEDKYKSNHGDHKAYRNLLKQLYSLLSNEPLIQKTGWSAAVPRVRQWVAIKPINLWIIWIS